MRTQAEVSAEIEYWDGLRRQYIDTMKHAEAELAKLPDNRRLVDLFKQGEIDKRQKDLQAQHQKARTQHAAVDQEMRRLAEEAGVIRQRRDELQRSRDTYAAQLQPGGIDWSRCPGVDREAHLAELSAKLAAVDSELGARYA